MKIFFVAYTFNDRTGDAVTKIVGFVQADSQEDACTKLGIPPENAEEFEMANGDIISIPPATEISGWYELLGVCDSCRFLGTATAEQIFGKKP